MFKVQKWCVWLGCLGVCLSLTGLVHADRSAGQHVDDSTLATSVKYHLMRADSVPVGSINVEVYRGVVQLSGFIHKEKQKAAALSAVHGLQGVVAIEDALVLTDKPRTLGHFIDDQAIQAKLKVKIGEVTDVGTAVSVVTHVRNGAVIVAGFVNSKQEINTIVKTAKSMTGVTRVHNYLLERD
jgi:osmotically-inducible protein OsmY